MPSLRHEMIVASAGSGKTYRLTNRYVKLLAHGVAPERIIALTFTRKASAEFLDEILRKLARAATDPGQAALLARDLELDSFSSDRARDLLRQVVDRLHLLTLGTLDSFFHRILACFPAEFGLGTGFTVMDAAAESKARNTVFEELFADRRRHTAFLESFRKATFGAEEKSLQRKLDDLVRSHHRTFLRQPVKARWGEERAIWPQGCRWLRGVPDIELACTDLARHLEEIEFNKVGRRMWDEFLGFMRGMEPGKPRGDQSQTLLKTVFSQYESIITGGPVNLRFGRKESTFPPATCRHLALVLDYLLYCEMEPELQRTRGLHQILHTFEHLYHEHVRRAGQLGFEDILLLLNGSLQAVESRPLLSLDGQDGRLHVDYRLDGQFDHWLLDEFQDTNPAQWQVIANLIDEVLQDQEGERSLFYVGDVKQAIFAWRGGDATLFGDIHDHYNGPAPGLITRDHMEESFRSGPRLIAAVNRVFGDIPRLRALYPDHPELVDRWEAAWNPHTTHFPDREDFVQLLTLPPDPDSDLPKRDRRLAAVAGLLERIAPHQRNLSCAVLVRKNDTAIALANLMRATSTIPVTVDADTPVGTDHPLASSFLSLLHYTAHPGDTVAFGHLRMTPAFTAQSWKDLVTSRRSLVPRMLSVIHDEGFLGALETWLDLLREGGFVPDAYAARRIELLRQVCHGFDLTGNRSIRDFLRHAEAASTREPPTPGVVQIMTIHKAKGLTFDVAFVAEFESERDTPITRTGPLGLVAHESGAGLNRRIDWVCSMPSKDVCALDPALDGAAHRREVDRAYEELCVLYVAITRAKQATYLVCSQPDEPKGYARDIVCGSLTSDGPELPDTEPGGIRLHVAYQDGPPDWFEAHSGVALAPPAPPDLPFVDARRRFPPLRRAMPSGVGEEAPEASPSRIRYLFSKASRDAAAFGTKVHERFEVIEWLDDLTARGLSDLLARAIDPADAMDLEIRDEILEAFTRPEIDAVFRRASFGERPVLWREKRFEIILDGTWISGTFDRVVLTDSQAWIYDFKTNRVSTPGEIARACDSYRSQLEVYRRALSRLTGLPPAAIGTFLVFTKPGRVMPVAAAS